MARCSSYLNAVIQPFAKETADRIIAKAASKLFGRDGAPSEDFKKADVFLSGNGHYHLAELYRSPDNQRPKVATNDVKLAPTLAVRRDKETPDLVATLKFDFPFFGEDDAKSFLWLANAVHTQVWLSLGGDEPLAAGRGRGRGVAR